jgi:uncharacterized protein with PQ loop repeat
MPPYPETHAAVGLIPAAKMKRLLGGASIFTLVMSVPQALTIWVSHRAAGVSLISWSAYLVSACLWLVYGLQKHDRNVYLPCIGWIAVDAAVILGVLVNG